MGMFDNFQAPNPPGYPQGQPNMQQPNFGSDPRQALAMAMLKQGAGQQQISPQAGMLGGALQGASNTMNSPMGMMALQKMMGPQINWNSQRMDPSQFAQPINVGNGS